MTSVIERFDEEYSDECVNHLLNVVERNIERLSNVELYGPIDFEMELMFLAELRNEPKELKAKNVLSKLKNQKWNVTNEIRKLSHFSRYFNSKEYLILSNSHIIRVFDKHFKSLEESAVFIIDISLKKTPNLKDITLRLEELGGYSRCVIVFTDVDCILEHPDSYIMSEHSRSELKEVLTENHGFTHRISHIISRFEEFCKGESYKRFFPIFEYHLVSGISDSSIMQVIFENLESTNHSQCKMFISSNLLASNYVNRKIQQLGNEEFSDILINFQ